MARARRRSRGGDPGGSLFPFLSVLACVIGAVALLMSALALGQMASDSEDPEFDWVEWTALVDSLRAARGRAEELAARVAVADEALQAAGQWRRLASETRSLEEERERLRQLIVQLEEQEQERRARASRPVEEEPRIVVMPSGTEHGRRPYFVECTRTALHLYRPGEGWTVPITEPELAQKFPRFLQAVRSQPSSIVVFLLRPDGVELYWKAQLMAQRGGVLSSRVPLPGYGQLDLGSFAGDREGRS